MVIAIIGVLISLLLPSVQAAREAARRTQCQNNLKNTALAVLTYESAHSELPLGMSIPKSEESKISYGPLNFGKNWVISVLPQMENQPLYDSFDFAQPINDASNTSANYAARGVELAVMRCPSDQFSGIPYEGDRRNRHYGNWGRSNYAANAGRGDIWPGRNSGPDSPEWKDGCRRGVMGPNASVELRRITDGTTKTILLGEIRTGLTAHDARGVWAMGHAGASLLAGYGSGGDDNGPNACAPTTGKPDDVFSDICDEDFAAEQCMSCDVPGNYFAQATVRSVHVGGAFLALCDGSVQFVSDDIETSGDYGACCTPWDHMIASADSEQLGGYNGVVNGCR